MFKKLKAKIRQSWEAKKQKIFIKFVTELKEFTNANADNPTMDKRIWSLYYFLGQHDSYDSLIITLNRFIQAKKSYTRAEYLLFKVLLFKLESPLFWFNRIIYPVTLS